MSRDVLSYSGNTPVGELSGVSSLQKQGGFCSNKKSSDFLFMDSLIISSTDEIQGMTGEGVK